MIHVVDFLLLGRPRILAVALVDLGPGHGLAVVDGGPESDFDHLVTGLHALGRRPEEVKHLLLTHIHLDHAGGAWRWAREYGTTVYVHPRGAAHLLDPAKLVASATRIYGDRMARLWGRIEPVPADRLNVVEDDEVLDLGGGTRITAMATPGHAPHHLAWWLADAGAVFAGDVAGVLIGQGPVVPPCPPPDIDVELWRTSLERLRGLGARDVYVTHFGRLDDPARRFAELEERLVSWAGWMLEHLREGRVEADLVRDFEAFVADELRAKGLGKEEIEDYEQADPAFMSVTGLGRYWRKHHPELIELRS